ncbi:MAG: ClC family H(+)/Cl(-) exchange transporter [Eubacteriales bacterium]
MADNIKRSNIPEQKNVKIILISTLIGILAGLVAVCYRVMLTEAEELSFAMYRFIDNHKSWMPVLFIGLAVVGYLIGMLTQKFDLISGSGIPQVKAQILGYIEGTWISTLLAKLLGGTVSIIAGLSLGREGPSIQLGACVAQGVANKFTDSPSEKRIYIASGASAGLAAAFNAPLAGVMFALEEIFKYFSPMVLLSTMVAAVVADFISKIFFGISHVFDFQVTETVPIQFYWLFIILGILLGFAGVFYNICLIKTQKLYANIRFVNSRIKQMIPFIMAGILGLTFPIVLCGGHSLITALDMNTSLTFIIIAFILKFIFSMISFGSGAPGGIFFPLLVLGSTLGAIFAKIIIPLTGMNEALFYNFIIIAMAAYFAAIVRAPLTGIILLVEMTGSLTQLLPLIITSAVAYIVAEELHNKPIYESLLDNLLRKKGFHEPEEAPSKILLEMIVNFGSNITDKKIKDITIPATCLIVSIKRGEINLTPNGSTTIRAGDYLTILTSTSNEIEVREALEAICSESI